MVVSCRGFSNNNLRWFTIYRREIDMVLGNGRTADNLRAQFAVDGRRTSHSSLPQEAEINPPWAKLFNIFANARKRKILHTDFDRIALFFLKINWKLKAAYSWEIFYAEQTQIDRHLKINSNEIFVHILQREDKE